MHSLSFSINLGYSSGQIVSFVQNYYYYQYNNNMDIFHNNLNNYKYSFQN